MAPQPFYTGLLVAGTVHLHTLRMAVPATDCCCAAPQAHGFGGGATAEAAARLADWLRNVGGGGFLADAQRRLEEVLHCRHCVYGNLQRAA